MNTTAQVKNELPSPSNGLLPLVNYSQEVTLAQSSDSSRGRDSMRASRCLQKDGTERRALRVGFAAAGQRRATRLFQGALRSSAASTSLVIASAVPSNHTAREAKTLTDTEGLRSWHVPVSGRLLRLEDGGGRELSTGRP